jgi:predicted secreted protein
VIILTQAKAAYGTTISIDATAIAELTNIGGVDISMDTIDVTSHDSANAYREFIGGLVDAGEVPVEGNFYPGDAGQVALLTALNARTASAFVITFPASVGASWSFNALVTGFKAADAPVDGQLPFSANLKISGKPTLTATASATASTGLTDPFFVVSGAGTTIVPAAAGNVYEYVVNIATAIDAVTITPTAAAGVITVSANGTNEVVTSGQASGSITLGAAGSITEATMTVQESSKTAKVYTLHLVRAAGA